MVPTPFSSLQSFQVLSWIFLTIRNFSWMTVIDQKGLKSLRSLTNVAEPSHVYHKIWSIGIFYDLTQRHFCHAIKKSSSWTFTIKGETSKYRMCKIEIEILIFFCQLIQKEFMSILSPYHNIFFNISLVYYRTLKVHSMCNIIYWPFEFLFVCQHKRIV